MKTYLQQTKYQTYKYVRRVPKELLDYISIKSFRISLGSDKSKSAQTALGFNSAIDEALQLAKLELDREIVISRLGDLIPKQKVKENKPKSSEEGVFKDLVFEYLDSQKDNISAGETRDKRYFYEQVCSAVFQEIGLTCNPVLKDINYNHLLKFRNIITKLPKRNIQKYRIMEVSKILQTLEVVTEEEKLSSRTINKYIKWLRALLNFAIRLNYIQVNLANSLPLQKSIDDKLQRLPLSDLEIKSLLDTVSRNMTYLLSVLSYTGMRLSELYKCKVVTIDEIKCFSLMDRSIKLKTKSSYRIIPLHKNLLENIDSFEELRAKVSSENLSKTISATIKKLEFQDKEKKSLYSLRHSFATKLIQKGANPSIVSELLGHAHSTMTLSRYSTGFSVEQLREVVEYL